MATEKNRRDMEQRKIHYDQISFLFPKGGRRLLRAMGIKERCTAADVIRRAILARAGLEKIPDGDNLDALDAAESPREATDALIDCQRVEYLKKRPTLPDEYLVMPNTFAREEIAALDAIRDALTRQTRAGEFAIKIPGETIRTIQRLVSRLESNDDIL